MIRIIRFGFETNLRFFFFCFPSFSIRSSDINDQQKQRDESTRETEIQRMGKYTVNDRSCIFVSGYNTHL